MQKGDFALISRVVCFSVVKRRHAVFAGKTGKICQCFISEIFRLHNQFNRSYRLLQRRTGVGSTFAPEAPPAASQAPCREADMSCRRVVQHDTGGEGSLSGRCLPLDTSRLAACCRVKGQKLLLSRCCIADRRATSVFWRLSPDRTDLQEHMLPGTRCHTLGVTRLWCHRFQSNSSA